MRWIALVAAAAFSLDALAATPAAVRGEIDALLGKLQSSGCQFKRNGSWHSSQEAREHLMRKFDYLDKRGKFDSVEQFIELAATKSSTSGQAYEVQCAGQPAVSSKAWLMQQLTAIRKK